MSELLALLGGLVGLAGAAFGWWTKREARKESLEYRNEKDYLQKELEALDAAYLQAQLDGDVNRIAALHKRLRDIKARIEVYTAERTGGNSAGG